MDINGYWILVDIKIEIDTNIQKYRKASINQYLS